MLAFAFRTGLKIVVCTTLTSLAGAETPSGSPEHWPMPVMDNHPYSLVLIDRLEYGNSVDGDSLLWDVQGWYGGDYNKLWVKSEGEGPTGQSLEVIESQVLFNRTFSPFWGWQAGVRHDAVPGGADTAYAVFGAQGLAPQWFETDVALFVSEDGDVSLRGEFEYEVLLTQRLKLQPRLEVNASLGDVPVQGLGTGLTSTEAGLRLRYELRREIAPYIGVRWETLHGETRDIARAAGESPSSTSLVLGIRAWF